MDIFIDYDTICINCQEKGYSFGYGFKIIEYKGFKILDSPHPYLNGACIYFEYDKKKKIFRRSIENTNNLENSIKGFKFAMINARTSKNNLVSRFTYTYTFPQESIKDKQIRRIFEYIDVYRFKNKPYFFIFYSFRNLTGKIIKNFNFYQFYDFDLYGEESYLNDIAKFDSKLGIIYQYDNKEGFDKSLFAGIGSTKYPNKFECNIPQEIYIFNKGKISLRNYSEQGPADCAVALQWNSSLFRPGELKIFPIMMVTGLGSEDFFNNINEARKNLETHQKSVLRAVENISRQKIDLKLEKLSFSQRIWCS